MKGKVSQLASPSTLFARLHLHFAALDTHHAPRGLGLSPSMSLDYHMETQGFHCCPNSQHAIRDFRAPVQEEKRKEEKGICVYSIEPLPMVQQLKENSTCQDHYYPFHYQTLLLLRLSRQRSAWRFGYISFMFCDFRFVFVG